MQTNDNENTAGAVVTDPPVEMSAEKARGAFDIRSKRSGPPKAKFWVYIGLLIVFLLVVVFGIWSWVIGEIRGGSSKVDESTVVADATLKTSTSSDDSMARLKAEKLKEIEEENKRKAEDAKKQAESSSAPAKQNPTTSSVKTTPANSGSNTASAVETAAQRKLGGGVMLLATVNDVSGYQAGARGESKPSRPAVGQPLPTPGDAADPGEGLLGAGGLSTRGNLNNLSGPDFTPTKATLAPSRKYLLGNGTYARCALYSEIITEQPGPVDCRLTEPLYSADGSTVLAEAMARLRGVQTVQMGQGRVRVFTTWNDLETKYGRAKLDSLGAGPMGASGTEAWVDNHLKERYGGALVLSLFKDVLTAATNSTQPSSGSGGYTINNTEQNFESMAEKSLDNTINIAPTGHLLPGTVITVIVARDVDFSSVFENR
ncbi:TrbI/VirB10 family protein [Pseudomonas sp. LW8]|uniref:TrbI/VirB10 family protein n=1 Tax=Pseudomonas sp. LW8 TaxID=3242677 RepID=UPI0035C26C96